MTRALAATLVLFAACSERQGAPELSPHEEPQAARAPFQRPADFHKLTISTTPYLDQQTLRKSLEPMAAYLKERLQLDEVEIVPAQSYADLGLLMRQGKVDLGSFSPLSYVRARRQDPGLQPLVNFISDGSATSAGYIVVRSDGPLRTLEDLQGKRFAFVDPSSTTGFLYPTALLRSKGIEPSSYFGNTEFTGNHEASLLAVYEGRVDAAAIYQGALVALHRSRQIDPLSFRIIAKTQRTPKDIFCAREGLPKEIVDELKASFLALTVANADGRRILSPMNVNGFIPADDALYETVREVDAQFSDLHVKEPGAHP